MKFDVFEGFRRLNKLILALIICGGVIASYGQNAYIQGRTLFNNGYTCVSDYSKYDDINFGELETKFCFAEEYSYTAMRNYANGIKLNDIDKSNYGKQAFKKWITLFIEGLGYTAMGAFAYILLCLSIKYIATGFVKK